MTWYEILTNWMTPILLLECLLEGAWYIYFKWFKQPLAWFFYHFMTFRIIPHQSFSRDVRFWVPTLSITLDVSLGGRDVMPFRRRTRSSYCHHQYGIRFRLRYRLEPIKVCLGRRRGRYRRPLNRESSFTTTNTKSLIPRDAYEMAMMKHRIIYFNAMCDKPGQDLTSTQEKLDSELPPRSSMTLDELMETWMHPLDWFRLEMDLKSSESQVCSLTSEQNKMQRSLVMAREIQHLLAPTLERPENSWMRSVNLSQNVHVQAHVLIVFDTGASFSLTPFIEDFDVEGIEEPDVKEMHGIADKIKIEGRGWVEWSIRDVFGNICLIRTQAYYVPSAHIRLFSPQTYFKEQPSDSPDQAKATFDYQKLEFQTHSGEQLTFPYSLGGNLPMMYLDNKVLQAGVTSEMEILFKHSPVMEDASHLLNEQNHNLSNPQKELLLWHYRLGHAGQHWIQDLMRKEKGPVGSVSEGAFLPTKYPSTTRIEPPKCAACLLAKQHRRGAGCQTVRPKPDKEMAIRRDVTSPGSHVSTDQWVSKIPGRLPNTYGREQEHNRYHGGTLFYDHYSGYIHIHCQISLRVGETLHGKHDFERFAELNGVKIQHF